MADSGINESIQGVNDALKAALDYLTKIEAKTTSIKQSIDATSKSAVELSKGLKDSSDPGGSRSGGFVANLMGGWYQSVKFGAFGGKDAQAKSTTHPTAQVASGTVSMSGSDLVGGTSTATFGGTSGKGGGAAGGGSAGGGTSAAGGASQGTNPLSSFSMPTAVGAVATAAAAGLWDATPGVNDAVTRQMGLFPVAFSQAGTGPVTWDTTTNVDQYMRGLYGNNMSGAFDYLAGANYAKYAGYGINTPEYAMNARSAATMYALTGMDNASATAAYTSLRGNTTSGRLASVGIFTNDPNTGAPKDPGTIVDELWAQSFGNQDISMEDLQVSLGGGFLGRDLQNLFGDNPALYQSIVEGFYLKAKAGGRNGIKWGADPSNANSAQSVAAQFGALDSGVNPNIETGQVNASRAGNLASASEGLYTGWQGAMNYVEGFNNALQTATEALGPFTDALYAGKGFFQGFSGSPEGGLPLKILGSLFSLIPGLAGGGDTSGYVSHNAGTSTSDSIPAMLSRGEYVINARAAQQIGTETLDAMNSLGHALGSAFASPAQHFAKGGSTDPGQSSISHTSGTINPNDQGLSKVIALARQWAHLRYSSSTVVPEDGEGNPTAWGCATSVAWLYKHGAGINLPSASLSYDQWRGLSQTVSEDSILPGDLIFMHNNDPDTQANNNPVNHVEMYLGPGEVFNGGQGIQGSSSYPPVKDGIKRVTGGGQNVTALSVEAAGQTASNQAGSSSSLLGMGGSGPMSLMNPMLSSAGVGVRWAQARSLAAHGTGGLMKGLGKITSLLLPDTANAGSAITLYGSAGFGSSSSSSDGTEQAASDQPSNLNFTATAGGKGPEWLYQFLVNHGLRGSQLQTWWTIGMRESGGDPSKTTHGGNENWSNSGEPYFDTGLFQINNTHLDNIKSVYGSNATMQMMLDPNKNFEYTMHLSSNGSNLSAWALEPDGKTFNFSQYPSEWVSKYGNATMSNHADLWSQYEQYNKYSYSQGAYRTHEGPAKLHEGEMVMPALAAEEFRKMMREAISGGRAGSGDITINLTVARASEAEAVRFANKVKAILKEDDRTLTMRNR